jgi:predicted transcriptional regulator
MRSKKRYEITFSQFEILEYIRDNPRQDVDQIHIGLNIGNPISECLSGIKALQKSRYISEKDGSYAITDSGKITIEDYYEFLITSGDGFPDSPGVCDECKNVVNYRVFFKGQNLCEKCLNP